MVEENESKRFAPIELEKEDELRIFCIFRNRKTGKYRVTQGDLVFVDVIKNECNFTEVINIIIKVAKRVGVKIFKKDILMRS